MGKHDLWVMGRASERDKLLKESQRLEKEKENYKKLWEDVLQKGVKDPEEMRDRIGSLTEVLQAQMAKLVDETKKAQELRASLEKKFTAVQDEVASLIRTLSKRIPNPRPTPSFSGPFATYYESISMEFKSEIEIEIPPWTRFQASSTTSINRKIRFPCVEIDGRPWLPTTIGSLLFNDKSITKNENRVASVAFIIGKSGSNPKSINFDGQFHFKPCGDGIENSIVLIPVSSSLDPKPIQIVSFPELLSLLDGDGLLKLLIVKKQSASNFGRIEFLFPGGKVVRREGNRPIVDYLTRSNSIEPEEGDYLFTRAFGFVGIMISAEEGYLFSQGIDMSDVKTVPAMISTNQFQERLRTYFAEQKGGKQGG